MRVWPSLAASLWQVTGPCFRRICIIVAGLLTAIDQTNLPGAQLQESADLAWEAVVTASEDPPEGKAIRGRRIQGDERLRLRALLHPRELAAADLAAAFRKRFPDHPQAVQALKTELGQLIFAGDVAVAGDTNIFARVDQVVREMVKETRLSEKERFRLASAALNRVAYARLNGMTNAADSPALHEMELRDARFLQQALPAVDEVWRTFQLIAGSLDPEKARPVVDEILAHAPPGEARTKTEGLKWRLDAEGKPFQLKFTAVDGRVVDTTAWRGKVVLVDFWATWCGPCVAELPALRKVYDQFHDRGFEVVGISLDTSKSALERFQTKHGHPWPQYFDGKGWDNALVVQYGVSLVPDVWLIDKQGILRHLNARENLAAKVEKLLGE